MSNKSKQDIENSFISALEAMRTVGLPVDEKFVAFQPTAEQPTLLFSNPLSNPLKRKLSDLVPPSGDASVSTSKKQKASI